MFSSIGTYVTGALALLLLIAGGSFYVYKLHVDAEVAQLKADKATLQANYDTARLAVQQNEATIAALQADAKKQADASAELTKSLADAEAESRDRAAAIKDELNSQSPDTDTDRVEKEINDAFDGINQDIMGATGATGPQRK